MKRALKYRSVQIVLGISILFVLLPLPDPLFDDPYTTTIETTDGQLLGAMIASDGQWRFPALDSLPSNYKTAVLAFEDDYFYFHLGVNPVSIFKALVEDIRVGYFKRGGSTLSMQLVRMARGNRSRTLWQKSIELLLAIKLEVLYSKEEILNQYAAHAPFGGNVVGLSAASWRYFGRSPFQLSWAEATALAVLPNSPSLIFPGKNEIKLRRKRDFLLDKLNTQGVVDELTLELAKAEDLPGKPKALPRLAPRLLTRTIQEGLKEKRNVVSLDYGLQKKVKALTEKYMKAMNANYIFNGAVMVLDIESGEVKAYIGNVDSEEIHSPDVDIITANRSTGSLLKPFLYAAAIGDGLLAPKQLLGDYPLFYEGFSPKNFDLQYRGAVHADEALTRSLNLPFVLLLRDYGYEKLHQKLRRLGMNSLQNNSAHYGLSLILGGAESSLWELTNMYANFYRVYRHSFAQSITKKYDALNFYENQYLANQPKTRLESGIHPEEFSISSVWSTLEALKGLSRPAAFTGWDQFQSSIPISWKTGTSFGFRDAWAIGINGQYVVGVWVGNADGEGRPGLVGGKVAAPLMFQVFETLKHDAFNQVPTHETQQFTICEASGQKANPDCTQTYQASLPAVVDQSESCRYHQLIHSDQSKQYQVNSSCYEVNKMVHESQFVLPPVQAWYYRQFNADYENLPPYMEGCDQGTSATAMEPIYPRNKAQVYIPKELDGSQGASVFEVAHSNSKATIFWHLDQVFMGTTSRDHQMAISTSKGHHELVLFDDQGQELVIEFEVLSEKEY